MKNTHTPYGVARRTATARRVEILHAKRILVTGLLLLHDRGPVLGHGVGSAPTLRTAQLAAPSFFCPE